MSSGHSLYRGKIGALQSHYDRTWWKGVNPKSIFMFGIDM